MSAELDHLDTAAADPPVALAQARVLLDSVRNGARPGVLRLYRPAPTAAFGSRDRFLPGFDRAVEVAREHGFTPVLRSLGGRIAVYHPDSIVIDHVEPAGNLFSGSQRRFREFGAWYVDILRGIGADARLGEIPGEYCPGEYSVNVAGRIKAIGTAQRVSNNGWLFSSSVIVADPDPIRAVLTEIQAALGVDWDPTTGGAISEIHPGITVGDVEDAFLRSYGRRYTLTPGALTPEEDEATDGHLGRHLL